MRILFLILTLFWSTSIDAQKIVNDYSEVKNPKNGKLYFSEKENKLSIYANSQFFGIFQAPKDTIKPEPPIPSDEVYLGYWEVVSRQLVAKKFSSGYFLIQTDGNYIVPRGKNLLTDGRTKLNTTFDLSLIKSNNSEMGGLYHPDNFPKDELIAQGYVKNANGEYVKDGGGGGSTGKITKPVGVIRWDGWFSTIVPDDPIDVTKETRLALSIPETVDQVPFYGKYTDPTIIRKHKWNAERKEWEWSNVTVNAEFNGDRSGVMQQEVDYARSAGIDYFLFNYYSAVTPMSLGRRQFEALPTKKGLKAAYITEHLGGGDDYWVNVKHFSYAFKQDWYQKIDGKPLLVLAAFYESDYEKAYKIFLDIKNEYKGEIYTVLQTISAPVSAATEIRLRGYNSHSRYVTTGGWNENPKDHSHRYVMNKEWEWYQSAKKESVDFTPNLTTSIYQIGAQYSWGGQTWAYSYKANDSEVDEQWKRLAEYVNDNDQVKTIYSYAWNEFSEGGRQICPQLRRDGTIDDRTIKIIAKYVE